jgi:hypothetical protein
MSPAPPYELRIRALESVFALEVGDRRDFEALREAWSRCLALPDDPPGRPFPMAGRNGPASGHLLTTAITAAAIGDIAGRRIMFHAAGLADEHGRVIALVGPSGAGKSTAARVLGRSHFGYVTDETVVVENSGAVLAFPKPLLLVDDATAPMHKRQLGPDAVGLRTAPAELTLAGLVILERDRDDRSPELVPLDMLDGIWRLLPEMSAVPSMARPLQDLAALIERIGGVHVLHYQDVDATARLLTELVDRRPPSPASAWRALPRPPKPGPSAGTYIQTSWLDGIQVGGEAIVLADGRPVRLSPMGLTLWQRCRSGAELDDLVAAAVAEHGAVSDPATSVAQMVDDLIEVGLIAPR